MSIWDELGISPTKNAREIKKAYAAKSKLVHPEEHPEQFQKLHEAYKAALNIANSAASFSPPAERETGKQSNTPIQKREDSFDFSKKEKEDSAEKETEPRREKSFDFTKISKENEPKEKITPEAQFDFSDAIQRNSLRHDNEIMEKTERVIQNANALYMCKLKDKQEDWLKVFDKNAVDEIKYEPIFLEELYRFLSSHKMNDYLVKALFLLYDIGNENFDYLDKGRFEDIYKLIAKESLKIDDALNNRIKLCAIAIIAFFIVLFCMWGAELWLWSILVMVPIFLFIFRLEKLLKRRKNFYE